MKAKTSIAKSALGIASLATASIFAGAQVVSADQTAAPETKVETPANQQHPIADANQEIATKEKTATIPVEQAQVGDVLSVQVSKSTPQVTEKESSNKSESWTTTSSTATVKTTTLADSSEQAGKSKPVTTTKTSTSVEETANETVTTTETVKKTSLVEIVKEADTVTVEKVDSTSDIVFVIDKSYSMDSHIKDVEKNIEMFVRDLADKKIAVRLGLADYEDTKNTNYHDFNGSKFTTDTEAFIQALKSIRTKGAIEEATTPLTHIATSSDYDWGTGKNNRRFAFLVTDEDIDITKQSPSKETALKALQDANISLTVVGKLSDKKDFDPLVQGTKGLYLDIKSNFSDLLNKEFSNHVIESVQKGRTYRIQTDTYEMILTKHIVRKKQP